MFRAFACILPLAQSLLMSRTLSLNFAGENVLGSPVPTLRTPPFALLELLKRSSDLVANRCWPGRRGQRIAASLTVTVGAGTFSGTLGRHMRFAAITVLLCVQLLPSLSFAQGTCVPNVPCGDCLRPLWDSYAHECLCFPTAGTCDTHDTCHPDGTWHNGQCDIGPTYCPLGPGPITSPVTDSQHPILGGSYTVWWSANPLGGPPPDRYDVVENGVSLLSSPGSQTFAIFSGQSSGTYQYHVRGCNGYGCGPATSPDFPVYVLARPGPPPSLIAPSWVSDPSGSFFLKWVSPSGAGSYYHVFQNGSFLLVSAGLFQLVQPADGTYSYTVQACNDAGCGADSPPATVTVLRLPGAPGAISSPQLRGTTYTLSWTAASGTSIDYHEISQSTDGQPWSPTRVDPPSTSQRFSNAIGRYYYRVRGHNASGFGPYSPIATIDVASALMEVPDEAVVPPPVTTQGWIGPVPGTASVEGGAASYHVPIEVPPGRAGMQPEVSLTYSSRNGNGVAGVGWSVSATRSIYRCPATLAQDHAGRTVQHDSGDKLCFDGQRLITTSTYGALNSEDRKS